MNPVGFIYRIGTMCSVQKESGAFSSDRNSAPEDSIKTLIVLLYSTLFSVYVCIFEVLSMFRKKKLWPFEKGHFYRDRSAIVWLTK